MVRQITGYAIALVVGAGISSAWYEESARGKSAGAAEKVAAPACDKELIKLLMSDFTLHRMNKAGDSGIPTRFRPHSYTTPTESVTIGAPPIDLNEIWVLNFTHRRVSIGLHPIPTR
jgi:hypothetical protein